MSDTVISQNLEEIIKDKISQANQNSISFAEFMALALYHEQFGYYSNTKVKIGAKGDFITAPTIGSLFAKCLVNYITAVVQDMPRATILEFGAGTGQLAFDILTNLDLDIQVEYLILETSATLKHLQQTKLQQFKEVKWLTALPRQQFAGVIIANEVLDAMPVHLFCYENSKFFERRVTVEQDNFSFINSQPSKRLSDALYELELLDLPNQYCSEISLLHPTWAKTVSSLLNQGTMLIIDYGFLQHEYYHPQRNMGTMMAHYQHLASTNILEKVGEQDLTAHVNFSQIISNIKPDSTSFATMAEFLLYHGLLELYQADADAANGEMVKLSKLRQELNLLTSPAEMGSLFKVLEVLA